MDDLDIAYLVDAKEKGNVAYIGFADTFRPVTKIGQRCGEWAATFEGGEYAALTACDLTMFVRFSELT